MSWHWQAKKNICKQENLLDFPGFLETINFHIPADTPTLVLRPELDDRESEIHKNNSGFSNSGGSLLFVWRVDCRPGAPSARWLTLEASPCEATGLRKAVSVNVSELVWNTPPKMIENEASGSHPRPVAASWTLWKCRRRFSQFKGVTLRIVYVMHRARANNNYFSKWAVVEVTEDVSITPTPVSSKAYKLRLATMHQHIDTSSYCISCSLSTSSSWRGTAVAHRSPSPLLLNARVSFAIHVLLCCNVCVMHTPIDRRNLHSLWYQVLVCSCPRFTWQSQVFLMERIRCT